MTQAAATVKVDRTAGVGPRPALWEPDALTGCTVLNTRPSERAAELTAAVLAAGGESIDVPALELERLPAEEVRSRLESALEQADTTLFVSIGAIEHALALGRGVRERLHRVDLGAVGAATAARLEAGGFKVAMQPAERFDSESLLTHPALARGAVAGRQILIVKGEGGRGLLREQLQARGACVAEIEVYRRICPGPVNPGLLRAIDDGAVNAVIATSAEAVDNLFRMVGPRYAIALAQLQFVTVSARVQAVLGRHGAMAVSVAGRAGVEPLVAALCDWWAECRQSGKAG